MKNILKSQKIMKLNLLLSPTTGVSVLVCFSVLRWILRPWFRFNSAIEQKLLLFSSIKPWIFIRRNFKINWNKNLLNLRFFISFLLISCAFWTNRALFRTLNKIYLGVCICVCIYVDRYNYKSFHGVYCRQILLQQEAQEATEDNRYLLGCIFKSRVMVK